MRGTVGARRDDGWRREMTVVSKPASAASAAAAAGRLHATRRPLDRLIDHRANHTSIPRRLSGLLGLQPPITPFTARGMHTSAIRTIHKDVTMCLVHEHTHTGEGKGRECKGREGEGMGGEARRGEGIYRTNVKLLPTRLLGLQLKCRHLLRHSPCLLYTSPSPRD